MQNIGHDVAYWYFSQKEFDHADLKDQTTDLKNCQYWGYVLCRQISAVGVTPQAITKVCHSDIKTDRHPARTAELETPYTLQALTGEQRQGSSA